MRRARWWRSGYVHQGVWVLTYNTESTVDGFVSLTGGESKSAVGTGPGGRGEERVAEEDTTRWRDVEYAGVKEGGREGATGRRQRKRGWWNRKPPPRGSLVPRSTISRQHNSSPLVHSPQPSGTAETSTLILLAGSLPPPDPPPTIHPPVPRVLAPPVLTPPSLSLCFSLAGERERGAQLPLLSSSCP